jgi:hypothetical protein
MIFLGIISYVHNLSLSVGADIFLNCRNYLVQSPFLYLLKIMIVLNIFFVYIKNYIKAMFFASI